MSGLSTKETRVATKAELREEIATLRIAGSLMSNICFNLSQHAGRVLHKDDCLMMQGCQKAWDAIPRSEKGATR